MTKRLAGWFSIVISILMIVSLFAAPVKVNAQVDPLQLLAAATGHSVTDLQVGDVQTATLLNGRQVLRVKAVDLKTGEALGADFENGIQVDFAALQAAAGAEWRAQHGALTKATVAYLDKIAPDQRVDISVWLAGKIEALDKPVSDQPAAAASGTAVNDGEAAPAAAGETMLFEGKQVAVPLRDDQLPADIRAALTAADSDAETPPMAEKSEEEITAGQAALSASIPAANADGAIEAFKQANDQYVSAQVTALQEKFLQRLSAAGLMASYASSSTPLAVLQGVPRSVVEEMAFWPEIDAIYIELNQGGPSVNNARPAQNAVYANNSGYIGTGVGVSVTEGERAFLANPALTLRNTYDGTKPYAGHPTAVAGFIKSSYSGYEGLANGATVDSANGSYSDWSIMSAAIDWGSTNNTVLNHSFWWSPLDGVFTAADRQLDYKVRFGYDTAAVAAGNFGAAGCGSFSNYVNHPGQGYNVITVGSFEDNNNSNWTDDAMDGCSGFGDPNNDASGLNHEKPEVAAIGATMNSTLTNAAAPLVGDVGSGTSYASPMVAALAADIIQAAPTLADEPEAVKAIIMASAVHNIEGDQRISDKDGVGGVDFTGALTIVERGNFKDQGINSSTTFPLTETVYAYKGERVRFVAVWLANPDGAYTTDALPADLDLYVYRADGTTLVGSSLSSVNGFEIVDFVAPATETYQIKISKFSYSGSNTWLGTAWLRGEYRISPETGYLYPMATPLGTHLVNHPSDWPITGYWRGVGIRSVDSDHDLYLYTESLWGNPGARTLGGSSSYGSNPVDFVVVDGNHRSSSLAEHYVVKRYNAALTGGYYVNLSDPGIGLVRGTYGPYHYSSSQTIRVFDLYIPKGKTVKVTLIPLVSGTDINQSDLALRLYRSISGSSSTYIRGQSSATRTADASTAFNKWENFTYSAPSSDWYGLVVSSKTVGQANFYIRIQYLSYIPVVRR